MNFTRGPFSANVDFNHVASERQAGYQVVVSHYGTAVYEHLERDFEDAVRLAQAYIDWRLDTDTHT